MKSDSESLALHLQSDSEPANPGRQMCVIILPSKFFPTGVVTTILFGLFSLLLLLHYTVGIPVVWATFHNWWHAEKKRQRNIFITQIAIYVCFLDATQVSFLFCELLFCNVLCLQMKNNLFFLKFSCIIFCLYVLLFFEHVGIVILIVIVPCVHPCQ